MIKEFSAERELKDENREGPPGEVATLHPSGDKLAFLLVEYGVLPHASVYDSRMTDNVRTLDAIYRLAAFLRSGKR